MHEILILYFLSKSQNTMYGLSKTILKYFGYISNPSFGTLQPALKRLEKNGCTKSDKFFTDGGKPSLYYTITEKGRDFLKEKLLSKPCSNPIQLYPEIKIKLTCSDILDEQEKKELFTLLKTEVLKLKTKSEAILKSDIYSENLCGKMVLNESVCDYKNLYELIERLEKNAGNS